jgi:hypothetical protein
MATLPVCSECNKESGPMHCTGCDKYFCSKDFKTHRERMFTQLDKVIGERNLLQDEIKIATQCDDLQSPLLIQQINQWRDITIEKVKQVAAKALEQAAHLLNSKKVKIGTDFKDFSQELGRLKESENFVEYDLTRLNQTISQFKQELIQLTESTAIKLHTEESNEIKWHLLIYVEEEQTYTDNQQEQPQVLPSKLVGEFLGEYFDHDIFQMKRNTVRLFIEIFACTKVKETELELIVCCIE